MKFLLPLLLVGCTPFHELSYDELYQQASDCKSAKAIGCDPLWEEVSRRDEVKERRRKKAESETCPKDMVVFKYNHNVSCISQREAHRILSGRRY